jgi:type IV pilus assembly protein PilC
MAIEIKTQPEKTKQSIDLGKVLRGFHQHKVTSKDVRFFTEQLALLLATGTNLHVSLQALKVQMQNPAMIALVEEMIVDIGQGKQLSQALADHPDVFSQTYINLIAASEDGGET